MDNGTQKAAGAGLWDGEHLVVTIYGNDPATPVKDGFDENEPIRWKLYMHQSGATADLVTAYSSLMPHHDGTFKMLGLSMIETLEADVVGLDEATLDFMRIYPNPSNGNFTLDGIQPGDFVRIYDATGRLLSQEKMRQATQSFRLTTKGFYYLEIQRLNQLWREKVIIN